MYKSFFDLRFTSRGQAPEIFATRLKWKMFIIKEGSMANGLKPHKSLQQEVREFLEEFHKGCMSITLTDQLDLPESKTHRQAASMKTQQAITSTVNNSNYEQKTHSLKPGQKLTRRPNLDVAQMLKQSKRLSR